MREELLKGLTEEQIAKVKACKDQKEILKLAKEEGVELANEQLEAVSGGCLTAHVCPYCGKNNTQIHGGSVNADHDYYFCYDCQKTFDT